MFDFAVTEFQSTNHYIKNPGYYSLLIPRQLSNKLNDRCEKSKLEVIGLNKGISRKNEENSQLRNDVSDLESRIDEFQTNWASQEAELGMFEVRTSNQQTVG